MKISLFDYHLPKEMIATEPASPRDMARLFVYNRLNKKSVHQKFFDIGKFLQKGDVLVLNDTKVIPARLIGRLIHAPSLSFPRRRESQVLGRKFKILLLEKKILPSPSLQRGEKEEIWKCLIDGKGRKIGLKICFSSPNSICRILRDREVFCKSKKYLIGTILKRLGGGVWEIKFNKSGKSLEKLINEIGEMPLPPYIKQENIEAKKQKNKEWYQTIFAKYAGSVAAPTAGLHFTSRLLSRLKKRGIKIEYVTLHVGMGTFVPVKTEKIEEHKMHEEFAVVKPKTAEALNAAKKEGRRIVACGTTTARTLEAFAASGRLCAGKKRTKIFIYPPYRPKFIDALITNFHLPKSTLMMLTAAFLSPGKAGGIKKIKELYQEAIDNDYRFYSYGDAMFIL